MEKQIILLNGPSSSGKSTLAKALRELAEKRTDLNCEIVSIDDFLKMSKDEVIYEDDVFEISRELCGEVLKKLKNAPVVIIDHVITSERIFDQIKTALSAYPLSLIRITCPLDVLREREAARGNRCPGSAEASAVYLFPTEGYDLTVDTHVMTAEECASKILNHVLIQKAV